MILTTVVIHCPFNTLLDLNGWYFIGNSALSSLVQPIELFQISPVIHALIYAWGERGIALCRSITCIALSNHYNNQDT